MVRFYASKKISLAVCDLYLLFVTKKNVFLVVIHKMNRVYWLIVRRFDRKKLAVVSHIIYIKS